MTTDSLFARPSFIEGIASIADLEGLRFFNYSDTPEGADERALRSDWEMVGQDLAGALAAYGR